MAQQNTTSTLDGLFKVVYGEGPVNLVPEVAYLQKRIQFKEAEKIGKSYNFPVCLSQEQGVTYLAAGAGVSTLESSVAAVLKEASVDANQLVIRAQMDYEAAAKAQNSKVAFKNSSELLVENLMDTAGKRLEIAFLYGRSPTGIGTADSSSNVSATTTNVTMLAAGWGPGIWSGLEGASVNFYKVSDDTLVSSSADAVFTVTSINFSTRVIKFTGTATGISALDTALGAGDCYIHFKNAKSAEPYGIDKITLNSGSLFGIDGAVYGMWTGSSYSAGSAALTVAKILNAVSLAVGKGGLMEEADVLVSPKTFTNLSGTMTDLRRDDKGSKEGLAGFESIKVYGPNGRLNVVSHGMIKEGEAFIVPMKRMKRIGSSEASFQTPGRKDEIFLHVPDANAYELRLYTAQAIIAEKPAQLVKITGITNS
jgi:hypothetical protein